MNTSWITRLGFLFFTSGTAAILLTIDLCFRNPFVVPQEILGHPTYTLNDDGQDSPHVQGRVSLSSIAHSISTWMRRQWDEVVVHENEDAIRDLLGLVFPFHDVLPLVQRA